MRLTVLGSGSTGNAVLICAGQTRVLVDAGLSAKETVRRLALVGEDVTGLDGIVITHEHGDHAGGLRVLLKSLECPVYISGATRDAYISERSRNDDEPRRRAEVLRDRTVEISSSEDFRIGEIDIHPFTVPHDGCAEHIVLAHLSQRANNPDLAKFNAESALRERGGLFQTTTRVTLSHHKEPTPWIEL